MKYALLVIAVLCALGFVQNETPRESAEEASAETYEHLANVIIEVRRTEDSLVRTMLIDAATDARRHIRAAMEAEATERKEHLEAAARSISNIANEGGKRVQAVRQRLLKAGHTHHTDADTNEDYIWIDSGEKRQLLEFAKRFSSMSEERSRADLRQALNEFDSFFTKSIASE